nr:MAG TPA: hypothetical protein [Caudoviricetes sp.]
MKKETFASICEEYKWNATVTRHVPDVRYKGYKYFIYHPETMIFFGAYKTLKELRNALENLPVNWRRKYERD